MNFVVIMIIINVIIFVLPYVVDFSKGLASSNDSFLMMFWQQSDKIFNGEYYRLITSQFLHGNAVHIFFNMYTLWQIQTFALGMNIMLGLGRANSWTAPFIFLFVYLISGIGGGIASIYTSATPSVGASGAILGIFGFMTAYAIQNKENELLNSMLLNILIIAFMGFLIPYINNAAHAGGFFSGFLLFYILLYTLKPALKI
jgi:rhomboid protease GluP